MIAATRKRRRGMGIVALPVNGSLIYGDPVSGAARSAVAEPVFRAIGPARVEPIFNTPSVVPPTPSYPQPIYGGSYYNYGGASNNPSSANNLALLTQQYYSNPSSLTQAQWSQLQAAGVIPGTAPYADAAYANPASSISSSSAIDPATGQTYASELAAAQAAAAAETTTPSSSSVIGTDPTNGATTIFGVDWYWLAGGLVLLYVFTGKRR
jgi:hypothetical protein